MGGKGGFSSLWENNVSNITTHVVVDKLFYRTVFERFSAPPEDQRHFLQEPKPPPNLQPRLWLFLASVFCYGSLRNWSR